MFNGAMKIISGSANEPLAKKIAECLEQKLVAVRRSRFADGEHNIDIGENVRDGDVFIIQSICRGVPKEDGQADSVNDSLVELILLIDAAKRASAARINVVCPYYGYGRQDRRPNNTRSPISAKAVAKMIESAGANQIFIMEAHAQQSEGFFDIPTTHMFPRPAFLPYLQRDGEGGAIIVSPDKGGVERAIAYATPLGATVGFVDKRRPKANVAEVANFVGEAKDRHACIIDDIIDTAGTLCGAAGIILDQGGATDVIAVAPHGLFSCDGLEKIVQSRIKRVYIGDTIQQTAAVGACGKIQIISVSDIIAEAMRRAHNGESVSHMFTRPH